MTAPGALRRRTTAARRGAIAAVALSLALATAGSVGAPRIPLRDDEVLLRLPGARGSADGRLRSLVAAVRRNPRDMAAAAPLAELYLAMAAHSGDVRYYGYARSVMSPWRDRPQLPHELLRSRIAIRQFFHELPQARADLQQLLEQRPEDTQAWFDLAVLESTAGEGQAARLACDAMRRLDSISHELCTGYVQSVGAGLRAGYERMQALLPQLPPRDGALRRWTLTALAEAASRLDEPQRAEDYFREAWQLDPRAADALTGYVDFLLDANRPREALQVLDTAPDTVAGLLRRCLALKALRSPDAAAAIAELSTRLERRRLLGDPPYYIEEIRAELHLFGNSAQAATLAREYWAEVRSPASARWLLDAAVQARDARGAALVRQWLNENPGVYPALARRLDAVRAEGEPLAFR